MIKGFVYKDEIEKAKTVTTKKGRVIIPFVMFETPNSEYSDYAIKEDRPMGEESGGFIGNASIVIPKTPDQEPPLTVI